MKKNNFILVLMMCFSLTLFAQNNKDKKIIKDAERAKQAFIEKNKSMATYFAEADAYVIFPNVGEGAFIVGGASGNGAVYENGKLIGMAKMKKIDVGAQIGGDAYSEAILFNSDEALQRFKDDDFELSAKASAVLVKDGASIDANYRYGVAVFTMPKAGLSVEASVGGQNFEFIPFEE